MNSKDLSSYLSTFRQVLKNYNEYVAQALNEYDLTPNATLVLSALDTMSTSAELAKDMDVSKALLSRSVKELNAKGLIEISKSSVDKREQNIVRTMEGDEVAKKIKAAHEDFSKIFFNRFSQDELDVLQALLNIAIGK